MKRYKYILYVFFAICLLTTVFTGLASAQSDYYYEYGKYSDSDTEYAEKKTVYDWLRGSYSLEITTEDESGESTEDEELVPEDTPEEESESEDSSESDSTTNIQPDAIDTEELTTDGSSTETVEIDPFAEYTYPGVTSYNIDGVYSLFSGGYFYPQAIESEKELKKDKSEEEIKKSFENVEERLKRGQYYKFDDRVYQDVPDAVSKWNLYNGREYRSYTNAIQNLAIPEEDLEDNGAYEVSFPSAGSIETQTNYKGEEVEIPRDPFVEQVYLGVHSISNSQYVHEYRKEGSVYDETTRIVGSRGYVSNVVGIKTDSIKGVFTGFDEGDKFYAYSVWGDSLKNSDVFLKQTTGTPSQSCLVSEEGCNVSSDVYGEGWSVGYGRTGYNIPDKYVKSGEDYKFVLRGEVKVNVEKYTLVREKDGKECINWKYDPETVEDDENVCLEEEQQYAWVLDPELRESFEVSRPASVESETFQFQGGFKYTPEYEVDTDSDYGDDITIQKGLLPDEEYIYKVKTDINGNREQWKSIQASPESKIQSGWHHFTSRNKGWDRMFEPDYTEQESFKWPWEIADPNAGIHTSRIRPINVHTYQHSNPHTQLSSGSDAFEIQSFNKTRYKDKYQALLDYHKSCWIEQPEDEDDINEKNPKELALCNWTHTAEGVGFTDKESESKEFYTGQYRKDAYVPHERITSLTFHTNKPYNGFIINGLVEGVMRYDTVDTTRNVKELSTNANEIDSVEDIPVSICEPGSLDSDCVVNPDTAGYDVYEVEIEEKESESTVTTEDEGIQEILIEKGLSSGDISESVETERVDSSSVLGPNDKHYLTVNTKVTPQVVKLKTNTVDWTTLDTDKQAYVSTSVNVQAEADPKSDNILRTVIQFSIVIWLIIEFMNRIFTLIGMPNTKVGKFLYDSFIPTQGLRFIMLIGLFIIILDYFFGGFF